MSKEIIIINGARGGVSRTVKTDYSRLSPAQATTDTGYKATFIMEREITEPQVLRMERTEEEKRRRHAEGDKGAKFSAAKEMKPRQDGVANTVTSSTEDNLLCEPMGIANPIGHKLEQPKPHEGLSPTLRATDYKCPTCVMKPEVTGWRIRKLTPRECGRLMDCDDETIDRMIAAGIPKTQLYKLFGNSICVAPLYGIFYQLFIDQSNKSRQQTLF